jgi:hypothetical protein
MSEVFHDFFNSRSRDFARSGGCYRIVLRQTVLPPSTTKISQKNHFYAFINCNFKGEAYRTVAQSEEWWNGNTMVHWLEVSGSSLCLCCWMLRFFYFFFYFLFQNWKTHYSVKKCVFFSALGGIRGFFISTGRRHHLLYYSDPSNTFPIQEMF